MSSTGGTIVRTSDPDRPYKVVLAHEKAQPTEHAFATMREAEAFIRRNTPVPAERSTFFDNPGKQG